MADSNIGGSEGYENGRLVIEDGPTDFSMDEIFNYFPDQETTDPEQNLQQGFDPLAGPNGCLPERSINPAPNEAAASTQWSIAQQYSGQSPGIFTGNPSSQIPDPRLKKRGYDKKYRANLKRKRQELVDGNERLECENGRLEREKQELEEQKKSFEAENETLKRENETLKREKQELEEQKNSFEAENETLNRENETLKRENETLKREKQELEEQKKSFEAENETLKLENELNSFRRDYEREKLRNKVDKLELKQQNRTKRKRSMSPTEESWAQSHEEDSFNSAKNFRTSRAAQMLTNKRVASSDSCERKSAMKNPKGSHQRLKVEMQEISKYRQSIRVGQKLEAIRAECAQLVKETDLMNKQRDTTRLRLSLLFLILQARKEGDLLEATRLTQLLRTIVAGQNEQCKGSI